MFCRATRDEIQKYPSERTTTLRSLDSLDATLEEFNNDGGDLKKAKHFFNVIEPRLFNVPLDQVNYTSLSFEINFFDFMLILQAYFTKILLGMTKTI